MSTAKPLTEQALTDIGTRAASIAKYHKEHAFYGGVGRDFHAYAETLLGDDVPALLAEVQRLRRFEEDSRSKGSSPEIDEAISIILDAADRGDLEGVEEVEAVGTRRLLVRLESGGVMSFDAGEVDP